MVASWPLLWSTGAVARDLWPRLRQTTRAFIQLWGWHLRGIEFFIFGFGILAVSLLGTSFYTTQAVQDKLQTSATEQSQIEDYLVLRSEITELYAEYARLSIEAATVEPTQVSSLRRRVDRLLLSIQELEGKIVEDSGALGSSSAAAHRETVLNLTLGIEQTLSDVEYAEALIRQGQSQSAEDLLYQALDGRLSKELIPAIDETVTKARNREQTTQEELRQLNVVIFYAGTGLAITALIGLLALWRFVLSPYRQSVKSVEDELHRLTSGEKVAAELKAQNPDFSKSISAIGEAAKRRDAQKKEILLLRERASASESKLSTERSKLNEDDKVRRDFLADISHELRTPLTVLRGVAEVSLRSKTASTDELRTSMQRVVDEAGHVTRIVEDLFFVARSRANGLDLRNDLVDLADALRATAEQSATMAASVGGDVAWTIPDPELLVEGDIGRLRQLFTIIMDNAFKYGGGRPRVEAHAGAVDGMAVVKVRDFGPGVSEEDLPHVFERLYRGSASSRAAPDGSGLGLPMAHSIVEGHRGTILLENAAGGGVCVTVKLPLIED